MHPDTQPQAPTMHPDTPPCECLVAPPQAHARSPSDSSGTEDSQPTVFEATQLRPSLFGDIPCQVTVKRDADTLKMAEIHARRLLAERPGCPVTIDAMPPSRRVSGRRAMATASTDALGRVWIDLTPDSATLI